MADPVLPRIRQVVIAAWDLDATMRELRALLGVPEGFHDLGVDAFGLVNEVLVVGNTFFEVVTPTRPGPDTAAGRFLTKTGDRGGYMAIFQVDDQDAARERIAERGMRIVWLGELHGIAGTHIHPADIGGAIVSLDTTSAAIGVDAWPWAGPDWPSRVATGRVSGVIGIDVAARDPEAMCTAWASVVGAARAAEPTSFDLVDGGLVSFRATVGDEQEGIVGYALRATDAQLRGTTHSIGGCALSFV
jgi:hypothetical protein